MSAGKYIQSPKPLCVLALLALSLPTEVIRGQGSGGPLTMEGLHQQANQSAASRAFGGVTFGRVGDLGVMFMNPASMQLREGIQVSLGGVRQYSDLWQEQQFAPVRYYPNLSLLLEGMTDGIPDPDPELVGFTPADSVQRPFDDIPPRWSRANTRDLPLHVLVAAPFNLGDVAISAGIGAVQYANLGHYYQNNNVLNPPVLAQRPLPVLRPTDDNPLTVDWYQSVRSREGSVRGYGAALAGHLGRYGLTLGISGMLLRGSSDDFEQRVERGTLVFYANEFRADSSIGRFTRTGTSEYSGQEFSLAGTMSGRTVSAGFTLRPPTRITRSYQLTTETDSTSTTASEEDRLQLPWRGSLGLLLSPREDLKIGLEYEFRPFTSATYSGSGQESTPWHSSSLFRFGTEYEVSDWLVFRGGIRGEAEVFVPEGSPIDEDPVTYRVYSIGFGLAFGGIRWNVAYENANMKYQDIWASAVSRNADMRHTISTDVTFVIPVLR